MAEPAYQQPDVPYPIDPQTGRPRITVRPLSKTPPKQPKPVTFDTPISDLPAYKSDVPTVPAVPPVQAAPQAAPAMPTTQDAQALTPDTPISDLPPYKGDIKQQPDREVGYGEAAAAAARSGFSYGFDPALQGVAAAGQAGQDPGLGNRIVQGAQRAATASINPIGAATEYLGTPGPIDLVRGGARLLYNKITGNDPAAAEAADRARAQAQETQDLAREQQPWIYYPTEIAASAVLPLPGGAAASQAARTSTQVIRTAEEAARAARAARLANAARLAGQGAIIGGAQGVGQSVSRDQSLPEVVGHGLAGAGAGTVLGGALGSVLPRAAPAVLSPGQQAARTAEQLGASIPKGLASDSRGLNTLTANLRSFPVFGRRVAGQVARTQEAAGGRVEGIARGMTGGPTDRAAADILVRPGVEQAIENNNRIADRGYDLVRAAINENARFTMPNTERALNAVEASRRAAGHADPALGLDQFRRVARGATFAGAHRARVDAREAGNVLKPNPGYNAADFNQITRAMTEDLRSIVRAAAPGGAAQKQAAVNTFENAERTFGAIAKLNERLSGIVDKQGEGGISSLLKAANERSGDVRLLAQLQRSMPPTEFQHIGGQLLHELGDMPATGEFSLAKFVTEWNKLSDRAKPILFSPQHLQDIENIVQMGEHIKGALSMANTSHTAAPLIIMDLARDATEGGIAMAEGLIKPSSIAKTALFATPSLVMGHWLSSPATARAMSNWTRAYQLVSMGQPTPARVAAFKIATRNLANNLNVPVEDVMRAIANRTGAAAQPPPDQQGNVVPRVNAQ